MTIYISTTVCQTMVMFGGMEWNLSNQLLTVLYCSCTVYKSLLAVTVATESENVRIKFENVSAKLIVYGHYN